MTIGAEAPEELRGPDTVPAPARPRMTRRAPKPGTVLAVSAFGVFMAFVDATIVNVAFPDIRKSFPGTAFTDLSWVLNAYNIVFAAFLVAAGRIADLIGRRRMFVAGLVIFTGASGLCAVAGSAGALTALRVLQALGAACVVPASLAIVLEAYPAERRAHAVALLTAIGALAAGIGPSLGGVLVTASDWRLVFLVNVPIGIAAIVLARRHIVESRAPGRRRMPDLPGAMLFAAAVALLVLAVVQGEEWGWLSLRTLGGAGAALALGAVFAWRCTWHRSPILDLGVLRDRPSAVANAMTVLAAAGFYGYTLANVLFLTSVWGYSVLETGLAITPGPFVAAAVAGPRAGSPRGSAPRPSCWPAASCGAGRSSGSSRASASGPSTSPSGCRAWCCSGSARGSSSEPGRGRRRGGARRALRDRDRAELRRPAGRRGARRRHRGGGHRRPSVAEAAAAFDRAWSFAAGCLLAAGVGSLAAGRVRLTGSAADLPVTPPTLLPGREGAADAVRRRRCCARVRRRPRSPPSRRGARPWPSSWPASRCSRAFRRRCARRWAHARAPSACPPASGSFARATRVTRCTSCAPAGWTSSERRPACRSCASSARSRARRARAHHGSAAIGFGAGSTRQRAHRDRPPGLRGAPARRARTAHRAGPGCSPRSSRTAAQPRAPCARCPRPSRWSRSTGPCRLETSLGGSLPRSSASRPPASSTGAA
jgi:NTE family protein